MSGRNWDKVRKQKTVAERGQEVSESVSSSGGAKGYGRPQPKRWQKICPKCGRYYFEDEQEVHDRICTASVVKTSSFQLSSTHPPKRVVLFHDEREIRRKWLYHGILLVETCKADDVTSFLANTRQVSGSTKPIHFVELNRPSNRSRTTKLAALWANAATGSLWNCARFYLLGIALDRLDRTVFGDDKTTINRNIYNRFFEIATFSALRWFYADEPKVEVVQAFSEKRDIAVDDAFPHRPITKINQRETNITFRCRKIEMVNKHPDKEASHPRAVSCLHLVDLLMGGISQCYDRTRSDEAALEIENILREPVSRLLRNQFDPTYYKRLQVAWFPREPMTAAQLEAPLHAASFFNRSLPDDRAQIDFFSTFTFR